MFQAKQFNIRTVSTSTKNRETISVNSEVKSENEVKPVNTSHWQTYGFDEVNETQDYFWAHTISFGLVFMMLATPCFIFTYYPDALNNDWSHREAYIELRRREVLGLPLVDPNYVDPETISLPPDETLGDDDIII